MAQQVPQRASWQRPLPNGGRSNARPDDALVNDWHVVAFSKDVAEGTLLAAELLGEELVIWRHAGRVQVWKDLCIHRGAQLSKGWVV